MRLAPVAAVVGVAHAASTWQIENEAVVAALLRRCGGALELLDGAAAKADALAGGCAPGMSTWPVLDFRLERHASAVDLRSSTAVPPAEAKLYTATMWPPPDGSAISRDLEKCVRLTPHRSDSGGFFVALLKKIRPLPADAAARAMPAPKPAPAVAGAAREEHSYARLDPDTASRIERLLGGADESRAARFGARLFSRSSAASRVVFMTDACAATCTGAAAERLHVVHAGATVFKRRRAALATAKPKGQAKGKRGGGLGGGYKMRPTPVGRQLLRSFCAGPS